MIPNTHSLKEEKFILAYRWQRFKSPQSAGSKEGAAQQRAWWRTVAHSTVHRPVTRGRSQGGW